MNLYQYKIRKNIYTIVSVISIFSFITVFSTSVYMGLVNLNNNVYPLDQALSYFNNAQGTNNLNNFVDNVEKGVPFLDKYQGNEAFWFPTDWTNENSIKLAIQDIIDNAILYENSTEYGTDAYQEAIDTTKEALHIQQSRLESVKDLYLIKGKNVTIGIIIFSIMNVIFFIVSIGTLKGAFHYTKEYKWEKKYP